MRVPGPGETIEWALLEAKATREGMSVDSAVADMATAFEERWNSMLAGMGEVLDSLEVED